LHVEIGDESVAQMLTQVQRESIQRTIDLDRQKKRLETTKVTEDISREIAKTTHETEMLRRSLDLEMQGRQHVLAMDKIVASHEEREKELQNTIEQQKAKTSLTEMELDRKQKSADLDAAIEKMVAAKTDLPLVASHPVYQYFARRYGINLESVMWEPEEVPTIEQWKQLEQVLETHPARWMIWEGEPNPQSVAGLDAMGIRSLVFDPCGNTPDDGDFIAVMKANVANLRAAFD